MSKTVHIIGGSIDPVLSGTIWGIPNDVFEDYLNKEKIWYWDAVGKYVCDEYMADEIFKASKKLK